MTGRTQNTKARTGRLVAATIATALFGTLVAATDAMASRGQETALAQPVAETAQNATRLHSEATPADAVAPGQTRAAQAFVSQAAATQPGGSDPIKAVTKDDCATPGACVSEKPAPW